MEVLHTVCRECGARWKASGVQSPSHCITEGCEAGWLDIAQFVKKADADRAAEAFAREREVV